MSVIAIIQARMSSTRLPGKVLMDIAEGTTVLECMLARVAASTEIDKTIIATTINPNDQVLVDYLEKIGQPYFVGSEDDVLDRYYQAAMYHGAQAGDTIVRLTSDCPIIDPKVIDETIQFFTSGDFDYASNNLEPYTYADGMDTEVFTFDALERAWKEATLQPHREHVTFYMWKNPNIFTIGQYTNPQKNRAVYRLTVDYREDLQLLRAVYATLYPKNKLFTMNEILDFLDANPEIKKINTDVERNASWKAV